tara:strand:+ start:339 stop:599 length:261 start_codon:yes stop_codon:yes gene_type:complete
MAISEFTEVVLNIAEEAGGYRDIAKKQLHIPLMQESLSQTAMRNNMMTSSKEQRKAMVQKEGNKAVLARYKGGTAQPAHTPNTGLL